MNNLFDQRGIRPINTKCFSNQLISEETISYFLTEQNVGKMEELLTIFLK